MTGRPLVSLFSGAGGLDLGLRQAGFAPLLAVDMNPAAVTTYRHNHPGTAINLNLASFRPADVVARWIDVTGGVVPVGIVGGPPCQAFSISNVRQREDDPRRVLVDRYASIIAAFNRRFNLDFFLFENVPGLLQARHRERYESFTRRCHEAGFRVHEKVIDAGRFGLPQRRHRLIVVGINRRKYPRCDFAIPEGTFEPQPPADVAIRGLPEPLFFERGKIAWDAVPFHANHVTMSRQSRRFQDGSLTPGTKRGRSFRVLEWGAPVSTMAFGNREVPIHPGCHRRLSVLEAMLLQGFPFEYRMRGTLSDQFSLVGDAVPPPVGRAVGEAITAALYPQPGAVAH